MLVFAVVVEVQLASDNVVKRDVHLSRQFFVLAAVADIEVVKQVLVDLPAGVRRRLFLNAVYYDFDGERE